MQHLPTGTVTLLFTDIEGSTRLLQHVGECYLLKNSSFPKLVHRGDPFWSPAHPPSPFETFFCGRTCSKQVSFSLTSDGAAILSGRPAGYASPRKAIDDKKTKAWRE